MKTEIEDAKPVTAPPETVQTGLKKSAPLGSYLNGVLGRLKAAFGGWFGEGLKGEAEDPHHLRKLCRKALALQGEVSAMVLVAQVADAFQRMAPAEKLAFFRMLAADFPVDPAQVEAAANGYLEAEGPRIPEITALKAALVSPRLNLFRLFNTISGGIKFLVDMREALLFHLPHHPELIGVEYDLRHLLKSWFNIGFLSLERITWETPAATLEKLIRYEAVHQIDDWEALKHRLTSARTAFAFFHPAMPGEPVIFVEAALAKGLADNVQALISPDIPAGATHEGDTAIFYSISNAQKGLRGIPLGNFLIKQVMAKLRAEFPHLSTFATLSPIPNLRRGFLEPGLVRGGLSRFYQKGEAAALCEVTREKTVAAALAKVLQDTEWAEDEHVANALRPGMLRAARHYLTDVRKNGNTAACPVAHFHASNGALLDRINWLGDRSAKGLRQSLGMMVNYRYEPAYFEQAQSDYVQKGRLKVSKEVEAL